MNLYNLIKKHNNDIQDYFEHVLFILETFRLVTLTNIKLIQNLMQIEFFE